MSTTYNYRKLQGPEDIARPQAEALGMYKKAMFVNGEISLIEVFINGRLDRMSFYINSGQTFAQKRQSVMSEYPELKSFSIRRREMLGVFTKEFVINYKEYGTVSMAALLHVYDIQDRKIGIQDIMDIEVGTLSLGSVKSYYNKEIWEEWCEPNLEVGVNDPAFHVFNAFYNSDGTLRLVDFNDMSTYDKEYFEPNSSTYEHSLDFLWYKCGFNQEQIDYFLTSELLPIPDGLY